MNRRKFLKGIGLTVGLSTLFGKKIEADEQPIIQLPAPEVGIIKITPEEYQRFQQMSPSYVSHLSTGGWLSTATVADIKRIA